MRLRFKAGCAVVLLAAIAGCAPEQENTGLLHPNAIIVRDFAVAESVVTLDPSFGFSLDRRVPGVPPRQRAASVARAAAFTLADTVTQQLRNLGYDAIRSDAAGAEPGGRALIVTGAFRQINEGHRRSAGLQDSSVAADIEIDYRAGPGASSERLMTFSLDSRQAPREGIVSALAQRSGGINAAAHRLGYAIAGTVADLARRNNWPGAPR